MNAMSRTGHRYSPRSFVVLLLCSVSVALIGTTPRAGAASGWRRESVASNGGKWNSIAVNANGNARISFFGVDAADNLRYAERNDDVWTTITVDPDFNQGGYTSLALSATGDPRISYRDGYFDNLKYAYRIGGVWYRTPVDGFDNADAGQFTSLVLNSSGQPRISHYDTQFNNLKYSETNDGGNNWSNVYVDGLDGLDAGTWTSIALDALEDPHISYYDATHGSLKHASRVGGTWYNETVDDPAMAAVGEYTSMKIANGVIHISYFDDTNGALKYAESAGGGWSIVTVDSDGRVGGWTSLAVDVSGDPHISYYDATNTALKYAERIGGVWSTKTVDSDGIVGSYTSLALDAEGYAHISYYDETNNQLRYATNNPSLVAVDEGGDYASILRLLSRNPTTGAVAVDYSLPRAGHLTLDIYDMAGRLFRRIVDAEEAAGPHRAALAGTTPIGRSGVYYIRLALDGHPIGRRSFVVLR